MGWVDGKAKMVSERYLGSAAEIEALLDAREQAIVPDRIRHLDFGAVAAVWGLLSDLGVAAVIDGAGGPAPSGLPLSVGTYLALAVLNRVVDPCSKRGFADWWKKTAADRFVKIPGRTARSAPSHSAPGRASKRCCVESTAACRAWIASPMPTTRSRLRTCCPSAARINAGTQAQHDWCAQQVTSRSIPRATANRCSSTPS